MARGKSVPVGGVSADAKNKDPIAIVHASLGNLGSFEDGLEALMRSATTQLAEDIINGNKTKLNKNKNKSKKNLDNSSDSYVVSLESRVVAVVAGLAEASRVNDACLEMALDVVGCSGAFAGVDFLEAASTDADLIAVCRACELLFTSSAGASVVASRSWHSLYALCMHSSAIVRAHASRAVRELLGLPPSAVLASAAVSKDFKTSKKTKESASAQIPESAAARDTAALLRPPVRLHNGAGEDIEDDNTKNNQSSVLEAIEKHWARGGNSKAVRSATTERNLRAALVAVRNGAPVLLEGRSGAGKSLLVHELARMHGKERTLVELQLDDQMDSKTLLGTYVCTDVPGEFRWQPGALTQAVTSGCWVFIEDIDRAPFEVLAALIPLFESRQLLLPNRDQVISAGPGFQLLATRRTALRGPPLLERLWTSVHVQPLPPQELLAVVKHLYKDMSASLLALILRTFQCIVRAASTPSRRPKLVADEAHANGEKTAKSTRNSGDKTTNVSDDDSRMDLEEEDEQQDDDLPALPIDPKRVIPGRTMSERDLFKWLRRIGTLVQLSARERKNNGGIFLTEQEREDILMEAMDCFVAAVPSFEARIAMAQWLAQVWHLPEERLVHRVRAHKPEVAPRSRSNPSLRVGRARLRMSPSEDAPAPSRVAATGVSMRLLEQIACSVKMNEPVLLVGETGAGKTSMVQHLARLLGKKLVVQNMHVQSDTTELLGGFKPVQLRHVALPLYAHFVDLFCKTFSESANQRFLSAVEEGVAKANWKKLSKACAAACKMADAKFIKLLKAWEAKENPRKRRRKGTPSKKDGQDENEDGEEEEEPEMDKREIAEREAAWEVFRVEADRFERQRKRVENSFAFSFEEGALVKAIRAGDWVLLDEINLASGETLERLSALLDDEEGTLSLTERGDLERVKRHPDFRLFAAMNPATDVGKRDLPPALRSRFTELYVDEVEDVADLQLVVGLYLSDIPNPPVQDIVDLYLTARKRANEQTLLDGANQPPRYSLRTLCRALITARVLLTKGFGLPRALYESFIMTFATLLNEKSLKVMSKLLKKTFVSEMSSKALESAPRCPGTRSTRDSYILCDKFWLQKGPRLLRNILDAMPESGPAAEAAKLEAAIEDRAAQSLLDAFVETPTVLHNIQALARAIAAQKYPVLLQGPTSSGKTTMVSYLAAKAGYKCVRINNHEHTDLQEYMGSYVSDERGNLVFREGALVEAVRKGYWIVLDELNLAPSEVLEALNRLLDDNREVFIPETQEVVKPHPNFMLFATQNPPGLYGGRKMLSRAFRNRFLELHVGEIPTSELETILNKRCALAPSFCKVLVNVMTDLQMHRQQSKLFAGKEGFITPRDLLRWANRNPASYEELAVEGFRLLGDRVRTDADKLVVQAVIEKHCKTKLTDDLLYPVIGTNFEACQSDRAKEEGVSKVVPTRAMRRTYALVRRCLQVKEPALLIGETGCGKTTVCQMLAIEANQLLQILNCHQNTDTADILGSLRPMRNKNQLQNKAWELAAQFNWTVQSCTSLDDLESRATAKIASLKATVASEAMKDATEEEDANSEIQDASLEPLQEIVALVRRYRALFEWQDGPLVASMRDGDMFLLDELSLAEDAVLERLNSVLEPSRTLFLAERGGDQVEEIVANASFRILATMNPGGDYGKRELSPALRNRFTEIWIPPVHDESDLRLILTQHLGVIAENSQQSGLAAALASFYTWFNGPAQNNHALIQLTLRDLISWAAFMVHIARTTYIEPWIAFLHGAGLVLLDGLGLGSGISEESCRSLRLRACSFLLDSVPRETQMLVERGDDLLLRNFHSSNKDSVKVKEEEVEVKEDSEMQDTGTRVIEEGDAENKFGMHPFYISMGPVQERNASYALDAPTTSENLARVLRAMQLERPILLEGSPGVGKTSLIASLAKRSGHRLVRINLSEQTDFADLIGSDIPAASTPTEGDGITEKATSGAKFTWSDGVFLAALKAGDWVLLDELNLASQSVLEGLNACLDHRGTVYVPELNQSFHCPPSFRVFAAQNPVQQGGGRKGLPKSFLNRFTKVFVEQLTDTDYHYIVSQMYPAMSEDLIQRLVAFNGAIVRDTVTTLRYARNGAPWEFNLRDIFRLCELCTGAEDMEAAIIRHVGMIYFDRLRTEEDRDKMRAAFAENFGKPWVPRRIELRSSMGMLSVGAAAVERSIFASNERSSCDEAETPQGFLPRTTLPALEHIAHCVVKQWPVLLLGASGTGKTSILRSFAQLCGRRLHEFAVTSSTDSTELLGCFEQVDLDRKVRELRSSLMTLCCTVLRQIFMLGDSTESSKTLECARALEEHRHILLHGPTPLPRPMLEAVFTDLCKILGPKNPHHLHESQLEYFQSELQRLQREWAAELDASTSGALLGAFEWVDGTLVRAMERGDWVVLNNANLCNPTVLDRLNPVLEMGGELMINECGMVNGKPRIIRPHKDFRIFLVADPSFGEVSRAMRNRCVEISLLSPSWSSVVDAGDAARVLAQLGMSPLVTDQMIRTFSLLAGREERIAKETACPGHLVRWAKMFRTFDSFSVCGAGNVSAALAQSFTACFDMEMPSEALNPTGTADAEAGVLSDSSRAQLVLDTARFPWACAPVLGDGDARLLHVLQTGAALALLDMSEGDMNSSSTRAAVSHFIHAATESDWSLRAAFAIDLGNENLANLTAFIQQKWELMRSNDSPPVSRKMLQEQLIDEALVDDTMRFCGHLVNIAFSMWIDLFLEDNRVPKPQSQANGNTSDSRANTFYDAIVLCARGELSKSEIRVPGAAILPVLLMALTKFVEIVAKVLLKNCQYVELETRNVVVKLLRNLITIRTNMVRIMLDVGIRFSSKDVPQLHLAMSKVSLEARAAAKSCGQICKALSAQGELQIAVQDLRHAFKRVDKALGAHSSQCALAFSASQSVSDESSNSATLVVAERDAQVARKLWKQCGQPRPMRSKPLFEALYRALMLSKQTWLLSGTSFRSALEAGHLSLIVNDEHRQMLIDAACALRWANAQRSDSDATMEETANAVEQIIRRIDEVAVAKQTLIQSANTEYRMLGAVDQWPVMSNDQLCKLADPEANKALRGQAPEASLHWGLVQLQPLMDLWACKALLRVIVQAYANPESSANPAIIEEMVSYVSEVSSIPPHILVPFKELALRKEAKADCSNLELDLMHSFYEAVWSGMFNEREGVDADASAHIREDLAKFIVKNKNFGPLVEVDTFSDGLGAGLPRLFQDLVSVVVFRVVRGSGVGLDSNQPRDRATKPFGETISIRDRSMRLAQLQVLLSHLVHDSRKNLVGDLDASTVVEDDRQLFWYHLETTLHSVCNTSEEVHSVLRMHLMNPEKMDRVTVEHFQNALQLIDAKLAKFESPLIDRTLRQLMRTFENAIDRTNLAMSWTLLALFRLHMLAPASAVDPCLKPQVRLLRASGTCEEIKAELMVREQNDSITGRAFGPLAHVHEGLIEQREKLTEEIAELRERVVYRPMVGDAGFSSLYSAVAEFNSSIGAVQRVLDVTQAIQSRLHDADTQEEMILEACRQLCMSLERDYQGFEDVVRPVQVSLRQLQHGLRSLGYESRRNLESSQRTESLSEVRRILGAFPSTLVDASHTRTRDPLVALESTLHSRNLVNRRTWTRMLEAVFARTACLMTQLSGEKRSEEAWGLVSRILSSFADEYLTEKVERKKREEEENLSFRFKTREHLAAGTPEAIQAQEEASFREMFPDFHEEFDQVAKQVLADLDEFAIDDEDDRQQKMDDEDEDDADGETGEAGDRLEGLERRSYVVIVERVLSLLSDASKRVGVSKINLQDFFGPAYHAAGIFADPLELQVGAPPGGLLGAHLLALGLGASDCQRRSKLVPLANEPQDVTVDLGEVVPVKKNLNQDSFVEEVALLEIPLIQLSTKLDELLAMWPDNAPLLQLAKLTMRLRELPLTCPLMRALVGIETLLRVANDWEMVAHKDVSIRAFTAPFVRLVVRWRKLELRSWPFLLEDRARSAKDEAKLWFYDTFALVNGDLEDADAADGLFKTMDQFARTGTLGCFETRLELVRALGELLQRKRISSEEGSNNGESTELENQFWHLQKYYAQWVADIRATAERQRAPIKQKLRDQVKLAKWDDRNYYALKESAEKTHRLLHRLSKEVDEILEQPVYRTIEHVLDSRVGKRTEPRSGEGTATLVEMDDIDTSALPAVGLSVRGQAKGTSIVPGISEVAPMDTPAGYGLRLPKLLTKTESISRKVICQALISDTWREGIVRAADMNEAIVQRIQSLRTGKAPQSAKQRAMVDLFRALREEGLAQARVDNEMLFSKEVENGSGTTLKLFSTQPVLIEDLERIGMSGSASGLFARADRDFYKNLAQLQRLRVNIVAGALSPDMPRMQMQRGLRFCEHIMEIIVDQRVSFAGHVKSRVDMQNAMKDLERVANCEASLGQEGQVLQSTISALLSTLSFNVLELVELMRVLSSQPNADEVTMYLRARGSRSSLDKLGSLDALCRFAAGAGTSDLMAVSDKIKRAQDLAASGLGAKYLTSSEIEHLKELPEFLRDIQSSCGSMTQSMHKAGMPEEVFAEFSANVLDLVDLGENFSGAVATALLCEQETSDASISKLSTEPALRAIDAVIELSLVIVQDLRQTMLPYTNKRSKEALKADSIAEEESKEDKDNESTLVQRHDEQIKLLKNTRVDKLATRIAAAADACGIIMSSGSLEEDAAKGLRSLVALVHKFVSQVEVSVQALETQSVEFLAHMGRFEFLLLRVFRSVASNGFCKPPDEEEGEGESAEAFGESEGTGMGEGKGREDVTDEIEDEEQLLGQKKEQEEDQNKEQEEQSDERKGDDGMEMENEFEGEMYDVEDQEQQDDGDDDKDEEEELDREMGDLDREDEHVVDEKLWNEDDEDSEGEGEEDEQEKFEKDAPMDGDDGQDELRAKEDDDGKDKDKKKKQQEDDAKDDKPDPQKPVDDQEGDQQQEEDENEGQNRVDEAENVEDRHMDVAEDEDKSVTGEDADEQQLDEQNDEEVEDLPDDMHIKEDEDDAGEGEGDDDDVMDAEGEHSGDEDVAEDEDKEHDDEVEDSKLDQDQDDKVDEDNANADDDQRKPERELADSEDDQDENQEEDKDEEDPSEKPKQLPEQGGEDDQEMEDRAFGTDAPKAGENDDENEQNESNAASAAQHADDAEDEEEAQDRESGQQSTSRGKPRDDGDAKEEDWVKDESRREEGNENKEEDGGEQQQQQQPRERPNPWRDAGSAMEHWHRRLNMLSDENKEDEGEEEDKDSDSGEVQEQQDKDVGDQDQNDDRAYEFSESKAEATSQVLAPSAKDTTEEAGLPDEEDEEDEGADESAKADQEEGAASDSERDHNESKRKMPNEDDNDNDESAQDAQEDDAQQQVKQRKKRQRTGVEFDSQDDEVEDASDDGKKREGLDADGDAQDADNDLKFLIETDANLATQVADARNEMDAARFRRGDYDDDDEDDLMQDTVTFEMSEEDRERWNRLAGDTNESSQRLCEQLRLLLEPTLASKLRGDYRTGKRINMRRVIPYIASQFRKDKIWLRRTKPSKREYQVLLAIDDSKSMAACGDLALTALVTISKALTKLEVGQVGVVSFGDGVQVVHDLNQPFSDNSGASVVSQVKFDQEKTSIEEGLHTITRQFEKARGDLGAMRSTSGQGTEFRQLAFFISDGRFDSAARERVKRMVREAMAQRVLIVLVIVEFSGQESILTTRQASFVKGKVKMSNYLDDYPFPLYVILKDMESLPEVLADGLRQWFELLSSRE